MTPPNLPGDEPATPTPEPPPPAPPRKPWYRSPIAIIPAAIVALLAYQGTKMLIGVLAVSVVSGAFTGAFGSQWDRLPSDVRSDLEHRLEAAYGDSLDDLSDKAATEKVKADVQNGLVRADDDQLVQRITLFTSALNKAALTDCGAFARAAMVGTRPADVVVTHLLATLDETEYPVWAEISVSAVEAEQAGSPATRSIPTEAQNAAFAAMIDTLTDAELANVQAVIADPAASDADACAAARAFYNRSLAMDHDTLAVIAFADVVQAP